MDKAMELFKAERKRQIEKEKWTLEHDDEYKNGELLRAAMIYLHHGTDIAAPINGDRPVGWPWDAKWFKPKDRRSNLIRAGALMLAEKERINRTYNGQIREGRQVLPHTGHVDHKLELATKYLDELQP